MSHIKKSKKLYDTNTLFHEYVPAERDLLLTYKPGIFVLIDYCEKEDLYDFFITLNIFRKKNFKVYKFSYYVDASLYTATYTVPQIELMVYIDPDKEPFNYNGIVASLYEVLTHEIEHIYQEEYNRKPDRPVINFKIVNELKKLGLRHYYNLIKHEIFPVVKGLQRKARFNKTCFGDELNDHLEVQKELGNITEDKILFVKRKIKQYYDSIYT